MDPFIHYAFGACDQALEDSGLEVRADNADRMGLAVGSGIGGLQGIEDGHRTLLEHGPRKVSPFLVPSSVVNMAAGNLSIHYGLRGPNLSTVTACAAGSHNLGVAARMIKAGDADVMVAGGAEKCITPLGLAGFVSGRTIRVAQAGPGT